MWRRAPRLELWGPGVPGRSSAVPCAPSGHAVGPESPAVALMLLPFAQCAAVRTTCVGKDEVISWTGQPGLLELRAATLQSAKGACGAFAMLLINSMMSTVLPTPAPPNKPVSDMSPLSRAPCARFPASAQPALLASPPVDTALQAHQAAVCMRARVDRNSTVTPPSTRGGLWSRGIAALRARAGAPPRALLRLLATANARSTTEQASHARTRARAHTRTRTHARTRTRTSSRKRFRGQWYAT